MVQMVERRRDTEDLKFWERILRSEAAVGALISIAFAGTVWGIQLNIGVHMLTKEVASLKTTQVVHENKQTEITLQHTRMVAILDSLEKRSSRTERLVEEHGKEAAQWKHKIIRLEEKIDNGN